MTVTAAFRFVRELGLDLRRVRRLVHLPRYFRDLRRWRRAGGHVSTLFPVLGDWCDQSGNASGAYFHQDLLVARRIYERRPVRHIDVGSRIDGFVAHVAVFREIEVLDIRPMHSRIPNVRFIQADLMSDVGPLRASTDSLSCLHALEHFGLGRYGDHLDPDGHLRGFSSLIDMLKPGGTLYLSVPIGRPSVEFNAHRIFGCLEPLTWPRADLLRLECFDYVDDDGELHENVPMDRIRERCAGLEHGCGIYTFSRCE